MSKPTHYMNDFEYSCHLEDTEPDDVICDGCNGHFSSEDSLTKDKTTGEKFCPSCLANRATQKEEEELIDPNPTTDESFRP